MRHRKCDTTKYRKNQAKQRAKKKESKRHHLGWDAELAEKIAAQQRPPWRRIER
jgi:hypothetical protein